MSIGIGFTPFETRTDAIVRLTGQADESAIERVDVAEAWSYDSTTLLAELAVRTSRIGLGTAVISAWSRTPATIALTAAGLQRVSDGRFSLGLGAGSPPLTEGFHGVAWDRPVTRLRDTTTAVRALLAGHRLPNPVAGAHPLRLGLLPETPVAITLAALSPASLRLAGELADAWAPFLWSRSRLDEGRELLAEGEARALEPQPPTRISVAVPVALGADEERARGLAAWWLSTYLTRMGPLYPRMLGERFGMGAAVEALTAAAKRQKPEPELPAVAEELAREVTLMGTYDDAAEAIAEWFAAGADSVHLVLPPGSPEEELAEVVRVAAGVAELYPGPPCIESMPARSERADSTPAVTGTAR